VASNAIRDISQCISASYERILMTFWRMRRSPRTDRLYFGDDTDPYRYSGFRNPDRDSDPEFFIVQRG